MRQDTQARRPAVSGPVRSESATRAHAAGDVRWQIDLCRSPERVIGRSSDVVRRTAVGLGLTAAAVWMYDIVQVVGH